MSSSEKVFNPFAKFAYVAALAALGGLADALYLTVHHYTAEPVPCSLVEGCEMVLTSAYATLFGVPLAVFGAAAYLCVIVLSLLTIFGKPAAWRIFSLLATLMFFFTLWLIYLQAYKIKAFCQFCLLSAAITLTLFITALVSRFWRSV